MGEAPRAPQLPPRTTLASLAQQEDLPGQDRGSALSLGSSRKGSCLWVEGGRARVGLLQTAPSCPSRPRGSGSLSLSLSFSPDGASDLMLPGDAGGAMRSLPVSPGLSLGSRGHGRE